VPGKLGLDGGMIPRSVRRLFDERDEPRFDVEGELQTAVLTHRGHNHVVRIGNISSSGAMVIYADVPNIGEEVTLQLLDHGAVAGHVRWVRDGRVGINFAAPLE
jgi:PilZ domain-containing protein